MNTATRRTLTVAETAEVLGIGVSTAREAIREGRIPVLQFGRRLVVPQEALESLLRSGNWNEPTKY